MKRYLSTIAVVAFLMVLVVTVILSQRKQEDLHTPSIVPPHIHTTLWDEEDNVAGSMFTVLQLTTSGKGSFTADERRETLGTFFKENDCANLLTLEIYDPRVEETYTRIYKTIDDIPTTDDCISEQVCFIRWTTSTQK